MVLVSGTKGNGARRGCLGDGASEGDCWVMGLVRSTSYPLSPSPFTYTISVAFLPPRK